VQRAAPVFPSPGVVLVIAQVLALAAVIGLALAPRAGIPLLRAALLFYAFGIMP